MQQRTGAAGWLPQAILVDGVFAPVLLGVAALGTRFGVWGFQTGLLLMAGAAFVAAFGALGGLAAVYVTRTPGNASGRSAALVGLGLCAAVLAVVAFYAVPAFRVPPIHDISTDLADPPAFSRALLDARGADANPVQRNADVDAKQRAAYADIAPLTTTLSVMAAHERALATVRELGWAIVDDAPADGRIEATACTRWMGFKDDIAIRVRGAPGGGAVVDVRSVSRVGVSDVGANAARIRAFRERFSAG